MGGKANYFKIGIFVIFSVLILLGIVIALGVEVFSKPKVFIETYVDESVQGLSVGALVKLRGVPIGRVDKITFAATEYGLEVGSEEYIKYNKYVMLLIAIDPDVIKADSRFQVKRVIQKMVDDGLRLRLTQQALTGIAYVEADYFDPSQYPTPQITWWPKNIYIPSVQSVLSTFTQSAEDAIRKISKVDVDKLASDLNDLILDMDIVINQAQLPELSKATLGLLEELKDSNNSLKSFVEELRQTNENVNGIFKPVKEGDHTASVPELLANLDTTVSRIDKLIGSQQGDITATVKELRGAMENLNQLTEEIKMYPRQVIFGQPPKQTEVYK